MTLKVNSDLETRLSEIARQQGRDLESIVIEALQSFVAQTASRGNGEEPPSAVSPGTRYPLRGSVIRFDDPCAPALPDSDWEATR